MPGGLLNSAQKEKKSSYLLFLITCIIMRNETIGAAFGNSHAQSAQCMPTGATLSWANSHAAAL